jgi:hypothetical protein
MSRVWAACILLSLFTVACGSPPPPATPEPKPEPVKPAEPEKPEPEKPKEPEPEPETPPPAVEAKPKSKHTIGGISISDVEGPAIVAEAQKIGWAPTNVALLGGTVGKYENIRFGIDSGKANGYIEVIRPAHEPTHGGANMMAPKDQAAMKESLGAVLLDEEADVLIIVVVEDKPAEAKKLLAKLVKK